MKPMPTPFEAYEFTDEEFPVAATFSTEQMNHIKTELAAHAVKKLAIAFNPALGITAKDTFIGEHEYERGAMDALSALLNTSDDSKNALTEALKEKQESQQQS